MRSCEKFLIRGCPGFGQAIGGSKARAKQREHRDHQPEASLGAEPATTAAYPRIEWAGWIDTEGTSFGLNRIPTAVNSRKNAHMMLL